MLRGERGETVREDAWRNGVALGWRSPAGFVAGLAGPVTLDEVQRAPDLFLAINAQTLVWQPILSWIQGH